jgi:hypothetical protein
VGVVAWPTLTITEPSGRGEPAVTGCRGIALGWNICLTQNAFVQLDQFASNL